MTIQASRRTPIDDEYSTCEFTFVELLIYKDDLNPDFVSSHLGINPTSSQMKGEESINSLGRKRIGKIGGWFLSSEHHVQSKDVRRHLDWLLNILIPVKDKLRILQEIDGVEMGVHCIWWSAFAQGGPTLWPEQMNLLASLNLECSFDISFYGNEDDEE